MARAIIVGGTSMVGRAVGGRLLAAGWTVDVTGRDERHLPGSLRDAGAAFHAIDRADSAGLGALVGTGAELLVDCLCFSVDDARGLIPALADVASAVMISSKGVYVDALGRHSNSDDPPQFDGPILESQPTLALGDAAPGTRFGYGAHKAAAERALLDSGLPVTVLRASKMHGAGAARPREWVFVKRVLDGRRVVLLADRGAGVDHTSAAVNLAALVERVAVRPGARILNAADPDAPSALEISRAVAAHLGHTWREVLLDEAGDPGTAGLGHTPWDAPTPIVLDTTASLELGYTPVGTFAETIGDEIDWLVEAVRGGFDPGADDDFFAPYFDYAAEDAYLAGR